MLVLVYLIIFIKCQADNHQVEKERPVQPFPEIIRDRLPNDSVSVKLLSKIFNKQPSQSLLSMYHL